MKHVKQKCKVCIPIAHTNRISVNCDFKQWHKRRGYPNAKIVNVALKNCHKNLAMHVNDQFYVCTACQIGKCHCLPYNNSMNKKFYPFRSCTCGCMWSFSYAFLQWFSLVCSIF